MVAPGAMVGTGSRNIAMVAMDENDEVINNFSVYIYICCDWIHTGSFSSHLSNAVATFFNGQLKSRLQQNGTCCQKGLEMVSAPNQAKCRPRHVATVHSLWLQVAKIPTSTHLLARLSQKQL